MSIGYLFRMDCHALLSQKRCHKIQVIYINIWMVILHHPPGPRDLLEVLRKQGSQETSGATNDSFASKESVRSDSRFVRKINGRPCLSYVSFWKCAIYNDYNVNIFTIYTCYIIALPNRFWIRSCLHKMGSVYIYISPYKYIYIRSSL